MPKRHTHKRPTRGQGLEFNEFKTERIGQIDSRELRDDNLHFTRDHKLKGLAPVEAIQGVGVQTARKMHEHGIFTVKDLQDYTQRKSQVQRIKSQAHETNYSRNYLAEFGNEPKKEKKKDLEIKPIQKIKAIPIDPESFYSISSKYDKIEADKRTSEITLTNLTNEIKYFETKNSELEQLRTELNESQSYQKLHVYEKDDEWGGLSGNYDLSERIDRSDWSKIAKYMEKDYQYSSMEGDIVFRGWKIKKGHVKDVENALGIEKKSTLEYRNQLKEKAQKIMSDKKYNAIKSDFRDILTTYNDTALYKSLKENQDQLVLKGDKYWVNDRSYIYGGGEWYVIEPKDKENRKIWHVKNNGGDGDNWAYNNVATGGAGAIGEYIPYNKKMAMTIEYVYKKDE